MTVILEEVWIKSMMGQISRFAAAAAGTDQHACMYDDDMINVIIVTEQLWLHMKFRLAFARLYSPFEKRNPHPTTISV
jgi:hypothetical protein